MNFDAPSATFRDDDGREHTIEADLIIGADGAFSAVRQAMMKNERFNFSQSYLAHGYKELTIPPTERGEFAMEPNALHIWPRGGSMMIALPNQDRSFTCTLFWPYTADAERAGSHGFESISGPEDVLPLFERFYPDAPALMPTLVEDFVSNPTSALVTIRCEPWVRGRVALLGDAAHAIVPFYGQGMNAAFEDAQALDEMLGDHDDLGAALEAYQRARIDNANAIADMALDNFIEMRDKVGSRSFLWWKKIEKTLHGLGLITPLYNLVSFSTVPYAAARAKARRELARVKAGAALAALAVVAGVILLAVLS